MWLTVPPDLRDLVSRIWFVEDPASAGTELSLPGCHAQVLVNLDTDRLSWTDPITGRRETTTGPAVAGITSRAVVLDLAEQRRIIGAVLTPTASWACLGVAGPAVAHPLVPLADLGRRWPALSDGVTDPAHAGRLLASALRPRDDHWIDPRLPPAAIRLSRGRPVREVVDELGMSHATFTRRFTDAVGVTPKRFQRLARLRRVLDIRVGRPDLSWTDLSAMTGFSDQAHLIHDFVELTGITPQAYDRARRPSPGHVRIG